MSAWQLVFGKSFPEFILKYSSVLIPCLDLLVYFVKRFWGGAVGTFIEAAFLDIS